ncbi:MAG: 50S ribosomal protein L11 methyltransferase [Lachnospiraceae bacterium]|nr:50S ribosomal protein L11 methyltransferase [Lachnospiraceae bacterium]
MKWKKLALETTTEAVDLVSDMLNELGIDGIEIEDNVQLSEEDQKKMFIDILPELPPDEGKAIVNFYLDEEDDIEAKIVEITAGLEELDTFVDTGSKVITVSETEDTDWINNWKAFFKPFRVDDTIVIKPTWETLKETREQDMVIEIDPGTAFGTGSHETTKLCILNLKKYVKAGDKVLDLGCGSGILSIIARKLGASFVLGTDIDENAVNVSGENACQNDISAATALTMPGEDAENDSIVFEMAQKGCGYYLSNVLTEAESRKKLGDDYDVVVANILADVIIPLAEIAGEFMKPGAVFISSGIINTKAEAVKEALLANKFEIVETTQMGDWFSYVAKKN